MERIAAESDMIIEVTPESWRLLANGDDEQALVEAVPGEPLRYGSDFGSRRQLPAAGVLERGSIQRVVLGWSGKDDAWHLGLVLSGDLATERGSRWCGLAYWHDPTISEYEPVAKRAAQLLAEKMSLPFSVIPPNPNSASDGSSARPAAADAAYQPPARMATPPTVAAAAPPAYGARSYEAPVSPASASPYGVPGAATSAPALQLPTQQPYAYDFSAPARPIAQPALPLEFDLWTLRQADSIRLELALSKRWGRGKLLRVAWNIIWLGVFIILTLTTLTAEIAYPRPEILVWLGVASIILLTLMILHSLFKTLTATNRIVFESQGVRWQRGKRVQRAIPANQIAEVYVSQVVNKVGKRGKSAEGRAVHYGEINLYLMDGSFRNVLVQRQIDETIPVTDDAVNEEEIQTLTEYNARTKLQSAGLLIARTLGVTAEYDKRLK